MDVAPYLEPRIAPRAIFDSLPERSGRARFMVEDAGGGWSAITWDAFAAEIRDAALFVSSELAPGERAAIFAHNSVAWMSAALGIQAAGGVMVPIYPSNTREQMAYVVSHSEAKVLFVSGAQLLEHAIAVAGVRRIVVLDEATAIPEGSEGTVIRWSHALAIGAARHREDRGALERMMAAVSLDAPGLMLYTSGTSGDPKGVPLTHRNVAVNGADWLRVNAPVLEEGAVDLLWLPMSHIFGFGEACLGNALGWTTYMSDPSRVVAHLPEVRPSVLMSVPSVWEKLASESAGDLERLAEITGGKLRFCLSGGAGLKREVKELFYRAGILLLEGYGLTETSPTLTLNAPGAFRFDSVGKPLPSVELRLADDGEILARGDNVFGGYHRDPEATRAAFTDDGWFRTGDIGRFTEDGFLQIVDRKKDILVTAGGKNVAPANIERRFGDDPLIEHVVVYGDGRKYLVAGVWLRREAVGDRSNEAVERKIAEVNAVLARHETIKRFAILEPPLTVEGGFLTPTLKLRRKNVYARFGAELDALYEP